ncbi:MAG: hypothetical protein JXA90_08745 [Planctomycetes bacterium]|nr:hypothetical protein [Planctomycetota bacterium]
MGGGIAPPPTAPFVTPTALAPKLQHPDLPPCRLDISGKGAVLDIASDTLPITTALAESMAKTLRKRYNVVLGESSGDIRPAVRVRVISIEDGNSFLRNFIGGPLLPIGAARMEVEGTVTDAMGYESPFWFQLRNRLGFTNRKCLLLMGNEAGYRIGRLVG